MNRQPLARKSPRWDAKLSPFWIRLMRPFRRHIQHRHQRLRQIEVRGLEHLQPLVDRGAGILITPNHSGHADSFVLLHAADLLGRPLYFMTAWQVFATQGRIARWFLRRHGCFSVDREGTDLHALKRAVQILSEKAHPLVIFPEGEVYHINERVTPFREGPAVIALTAVKHSSRPIYAVPCAIKYQYVEDPTRDLEAVMADLERRILWRPQAQRPLAERTYKFAEAILALKEMEYLATTQQGPLPQRVRGLIEHILARLEGMHGLSARDHNVPERAKNVRRACLDKLDQVQANPQQATEIQTQLDDIFFVIQLFSYPGDYVAERPTIERMAETIDKFEEDVLDRPYASIRGARSARLSFGEPIDVRKLAEGAAQPRKAARPLTDALERAVQHLLDEPSAQIVAALSE